MARNSGEDLLSVWACIYTTAREIHEERCSAGHVPLMRFIEYRAGDMQGWTNKRSSVSNLQNATSAQPARRAANGKAPALILDHTCLLIALSIGDQILLVPVAA